MQREPGFYWVRLYSGGPWTVGQYDGGAWGWEVFGWVEGPHHEKDISEIGDRITPPEEK